METIPSTMEPGDENTREKLMNDLKVVAQDAEELLKATATDLGDRAQAARQRLTVALDRAKDSASKMQDRAKEGLVATDRCIREHPYQTIGAAFCLGLVLGLLVRNK
jgi:ElaB/YqjD/DUF883 family membrane-anchored ribosome-binding protein